MPIFTLMEVFYDHRSAMKMAKSIGIDDIGTVMIFYELKGWNNEKLELLDTISASAFDDAKMHYRLAQIYQDMKMLDNAEPEYSTALIITPYDVETHYDLAYIYAFKGDSKTSMDWLEKAINAGFKDTESLKKEKVFAPLRGNDRFKKLLLN